MSPMLASSGAAPLHSKKYAFEVKWDGYRALVRAGPDGVTITSRNGYDMTSRYPSSMACPRRFGRRCSSMASWLPWLRMGAALWFRSRGSSDRSTLAFGVSGPPTWHV